MVSYVFSAVYPKKIEDEDEFEDDYDFGTSTWHSRPGFTSSKLDSAINRALVNLTRTLVP